MNDRVKLPPPAPRLLFRKAALEARQTRPHGSIILIRPLSVNLMTAGVAFMCTIVLAYLCLATYARRSTVDGVLSPAGGIVRVYSPQGGIIQAKHVVDGMLVKRGDLLYSISSDRLGAGADGNQAGISAQVRRRRDSLTEELAKTRQLQQEELDALAQKIGGQVNELAKLGDQLGGQRARVAFAEAAVRRARDLVNQHFVSSEQLDQKSVDLLEQQNRLQALERDRINLERELAAQRNVQRSAPLRHQNALAAITRNIDSIGQELSESEAKRGIDIRAAESGRVTLAAAEVGQFVDPSKLLTVIIPERSPLLAYLYAPSRAIAFVSPGDDVLLRYDAYPYQKFGNAHGKVVNVSQTALASNEFQERAAGRSGGQASEPVYRITVALNQQWIDDDRARLPLQPGMTLNADVLLERRRLIEWILEPLFGVARKI